MTYIINKKIKLKRLTLNVNIFASVILCLFFIIDLLRFFNNIPLIVGNLVYVLLGSIAIIYSIYRNGIKRQLPIFKFVFIYTCFGALGIIVNGNMDLQELLWPVAFIGIAILLLNFAISYKLAKALYYLLVIIIMISIVLSNGVNNLNTSASRNTIGIMVLVYFSIYSIASYNSGKKMTIYPLIFGLVINIIAIGRSGILTFAMLILLFSFFKYNGETYKIRNPIRSLHVNFIGFLMLWIGYKGLGVYFNDMISNFQNRGLESVRNLIWADYTTKTFTSLQYVLFGTPISGTYLLENFTNNLHNSFFMLHAKYGIIPLLLVVFLIIKSFIYFIKTKNVLYFIILFAVVFRMQFDYTNFNAQLDVILFYFLFMRYYDVNIDKQII